MKKLFGLIMIVVLAGCATPTLDRMMYEDQISANQRDYALYRIDMEYANQDKVKSGSNPDYILSREEWVKRTGRDKYIERYERNHPELKK